MQLIYILTDEAGFNLAKRKGWGWNIIGHFAIVNVPGQCGGNMTMYVAVSQQVAIHWYTNLGPYNT